MRACGADIDDCPIVSTRDGKKGRSSIVDNGHEVKFKLQDGLHTVYVWRATEYDLPCGGNDIRNCMESQGAK